LSPSATRRNPWWPYADAASFDLAEFLYTDEQMSAKKIDRLMAIWAAGHESTGAPFTDAKDLYDTIDASIGADVDWESFAIQYEGELPEDPEDVPAWMKEGYEVWFRDPLKVAHQMLSNPDYKDEIDPCAKREFVNGRRRLKDFMSGDWAWEQSNKIAQDPNTVGSAFVPIILGSDKTTVSVGTGNNEFYPLYMMLGNHHNNVRRAHRGAVVLIGFLALPKSKLSPLGCSLTDNLCIVFTSQSGA
ncbi:hypothetical protein NEOLEDRAFT_1069172, partial [Neolentinus lepideus HHB14362 ss-1]